MADRSQFDETRNRKLRSAALKAAAQTLGGELDDHPTYETLAAIVDGSADDVAREIGESHADACPTCQAELNDLRAFAGRKPIEHRRTIWWAAAAALRALAR